MGIGIRLLLFLILTAGIWGGVDYAQHELLEPGSAAAAVAQVNGGDAAQRNLEVRQQRQTAMDGAGVAANFFIAMACFATWRRRPARVVVDHRTSASSPGDREGGAL